MKPLLQTLSLLLGGLLMVSLAGCIIVVEDGGKDETYFHGSHWVVEVIVYQGRTYPTGRGRTYTIVFDNEEALSGQADCNSFGGNYRMPRPGVLRIDDLHSTLALCAEGSLGTVFLEGLQNTTGYSRNGNTLHLLGPGGGEIILVRD